MKSELPPPSLKREFRLPFAALHESDFEYACQDLARIAFGNLRPELKRTKGKSQYEVDVECFNASQSPEVVIQSKRYKSITDSKFLGWVNDFVDELDGHWKNSGVQKYILAVTVEGNSDKLNKACKTAAEKLKTYGIEFEPWFLAKLTDLARQDSSLVDRYFEDSWVRAISAKSNSLGHDGRSNAPEKSASGITLGNTAISAISNLSAHLTEGVEKLIDQLDLEAKAGNTKELRRYLSELRDTESKWDPIAPGTKARILRRLGMLFIQDGEVELAEGLIVSARKFAAPKNRNTEALLISRKQGLDEAIMFLNQPESPEESEALASFLIARGDSAAAKQILGETQKSAEQQRLLGLASLGDADRTLALPYAKEAVALNGKAFGTRFALFLAHMNLALIDGFSVEIAPCPNPFNPSLARQDEEAVQHLDNALAIIDSLISTTEPKVSNDLKVWKLAAMACHPFKRVEAREYAAGSLAHPDVVPLFIVWSMFLGIEIQHGKLRKYLEDKIRKGAGDESYVVVAALLVQEKEGSGTAAAAVIDKHQHLFPDAASYFATWRKEVSGEGDADLLIQVAKGHSSEFETLAKNALAEPVSPSNVLAVASVLRDQGAFSQVLSLRVELLKIGNAQSIDFVVESLIESGDPDEAVVVLKANEFAFAGSGQSVRVLQLRAMASERSGKQGETLQALEKLDALQPSLSTKLELLHRSMVLNDRSRLVHHGRGLLELKDNARENYLVVANAIGDSQPDLVRDLVTRYVETNEPEPSVVPILLSIQNRVDLQSLSSDQRLIEVQRQFLGDADSVMSFESVDDVIEFINERMAGQREFRKGWLIGQMPAHKAFSNESELFTKLYYSKPEFIVSDSGDRYPPLLRAPGLDKPAIDGDPAKKIKLVLDSSALFTAARFGLMEYVEQAFDVFVPVSLVPFLRDARERCANLAGQIPDEVIQKFAEFERSGSHLFDVLVDHVPSSLTRIKRLGKDEPIAEELKAVLSSVENDRRLSELKFQTLLDDLGIVDWVSAPIKQDRIQLLIDGGVLLSLIRQDVLSIIADYASICIRGEDYSRLEHAVATKREEHRLTLELDKIETLVKDRLHSDRWRTVSAKSTNDSDQHDRSPVLVALGECLDQVSEAFDGYIWIEDRFVGRHQFPKVVTLDQVTEYLSNSGFLPKPKFDAIQSDQRESRCGFLDLQTAELIEALKAASSGNAEFIETDELRRYRVSYAQQIGYLRYIDWQEKRVVEDRHIGDPRHAIDASFWVVKLCRKIWTDPSFDNAKRRAISGWLWSNFRLEFFPRYGQNERDLEQYKTHLTLLLVQMILWPLFYKFDHPEADIKEHRGYVEWFSRTVLTPRFFVENEIRELFIASFVSIIGRDLRGDLSRGSKLENDIIQKYLAREVGELLDLFPASLRKDILKTNGFSKKIYVKLDNTIASEAGTYLASDVCKAIDAALKSANRPGAGLSKIVTNEQATHTLEITLQSGTQVPKIVIDQGKTRIELTGSALAISLPDRAARSAAFEAIADTYKTDQKTLAAIKGAVEAQALIGGRLDALHKAHELDFAFAEERLREALESQKAVQLDELSLPAACALMTYLRLDPTKTDPLSQALSRGYRMLAQQLGAETADKRYAACPFAFDESVRYQADHPLRGDSMFQFARALSIPTNEDGRVYDTLNEDVSRFVQIVDMQLKLFLALLRSGTIQAHTREDWRALSVELRATLIWIWADRLCGALLSAHVETDAVVEAIADLTPLYVPTSFEKSLSGNPSTAYGTTIWPIEVIQLLFDHIEPCIRHIEDSSTKEKLFELLGSTNDGKWLPHPRLIVEPQQQLPAPYRPRMKFTRLLSEKLVPPPSELNDFDRENFVEAIITEAARSSNAAENLLILSFVRVDELITEQVREIHKLLLASFNQSINDTSSDIFKISLQRFADVSGHLGETASLKEVIRGVVTRVFENRRRIQLPLMLHADQRPDEVIFGQIVDCLFLHANGMDGPLEDRIETCMALLRWLAEQWPGSEGIMANIISNFVEGMPSELAIGYWSAMSHN
tara:strand:- start:43 stop:6141 length:6099 start_codon:yes stop_codon:yes gene_type:complete